MGNMFPLRVCPSAIPASLRTALLTRVVRVLILFSWHRHGLARTPFEVCLVAGPSPDVIEHAVVITAVKDAALAWFAALRADKKNSS